MKVIKRFSAVLLSVFVALNAFSFSSFAIAAWVVAGIEKVFEQIVVGWFASGCVDTILGSGEFSDGVSQIISTSVMSDGSINCYYKESSDRFQFSPSPSLSGDELECAQFVCDYMNDRMAINSASLYYDINLNNPVDTASSFVMSTIGYSTLKEDAYNALNAYVASKAYDDLLDSNNSTASAIEAALGESFPRYYFDITNPSKSSHLNFKSPEKGNISSLVLNGFTFTPTISYTIGHEFTEAEATLLASYSPSYLKAHYVDRYDLWIPQLNSENSVYAFNYYYLTDDGRIFFGSGNYVPNGYTYESRTLGTSPFLKDSTGRMITGGSAEAREIYSHITSIGVCMNTGNVLQSAIPVDVGTLTDDDFYTTSGGETISQEIPKTEAENIIGGAIGMGLIGADAPLTIGADGTITAADGIPIDKLGEILEAIQSGSINLDSIEDYLSLISTLVGNGNLTMTEQQKILENIGTYTGATAKDIADIKKAIQSFVASDSLAITAEYDFDIKTPSGIIDKFPFSLPFDVYKVFNILSAPPLAPSFEIPFEMKNIFSYSIDVDLSEYEDIAVIVRWFLYIIFVLGLILVTNKLIGRG